MRDALPQLTAAGVMVMGVSPDTVTQQKKFHDKYDLGFLLLSDTDHRIAIAYGVWAEKKMYGKTTMGIIRSGFLIDEAGRVAAAGYKISPADTIPGLMQWLAEA